MTNRERLSETASSVRVGRCAMSMRLFLPRADRYLTTRTRRRIRRRRVLLAALRQPQGTYCLRPFDKLRARTACGPSTSSGHVVLSALRQAQGTVLLAVE